MFTVDRDKCTGCGSCSNVCPQGAISIEDNLAVINEGLCVGCGACASVCPTGATYKRDDGVVLIDHDKCIGCRACMVACPYESRQFLWDIRSYFEGQLPTPFEQIKQKSFDRGTVVKCNFCLHRLEQGRLSACVETCPAQARAFGDLDDPESEVSRLIVLYRGAPFREELGTKPSVYYIKG